MIIGLLACGAAFFGFKLGGSQVALEWEQRRLAVVDRKLETQTEFPDDICASDTGEAERILEDLVDGVEGARAWVRTLRQAAAEAGLEMRIRWGESARPIPAVSNLEQVMVVIEMDSSASTHGATRRMTGFLRGLRIGRPPFEVSRVRWTGLGRGLVGVVLEGRLWIRRSEP